MDRNPICATTLMNLALATLPLYSQIVVVTDLGSPLSPSRRRRSSAYWSNKMLRLAILCGLTLWTGSLQAEQARLLAEESAEIAVVGPNRGERQVFPRISESPSTPLAR